MILLTSTSDVIKAVTTATPIAWNPSSKAAGIGLTNGNLTASGTINSDNAVRCNTSISGTDKKYWEITWVTLFSTPQGVVGIESGTYSLTVFPGNSGTGGIGLDGNGDLWNNGSGSAAGFSFTQGDVICLACDYANKKLWIRVNGGNWNNSGTDNPATNTGGYIFTDVVPVYPVVDIGTSSSAQVCTANFGATSFAQTAPSGFTGFTPAFGNIVCNASWMDNSAGTITVGRTNTAAITSATTTTIVGSPGSSVQRSAESITIRNNHATSSSIIKVQHYDGTNTSDLTPNITLLAGEEIMINEIGKITHSSITGAKYDPVLPNPRPSLSGYIAETFPRELTQEAAALPASSGFLYLHAIQLKARTIVSTITVVAAQSATSPTHGWLALYSKDGKLLAVSSDMGSTAITGAGQVVALNMVSAFTVPKDDLFYIGIAVVATGVWTAKGYAAIAAQLGTVIPITCCQGASGITTVMPDVVTFTTAQASRFWAAVS